MLLALSDRPLFVRGMQGLGDNIYQRAVIRELVAQRGPVWLATSWPQLYSDMPEVRIVNPNTRLRTQAKNVRRQRRAWATVPGRARRLEINYGHESLSRLNTVEAMLECVGLPLDTPLYWDLPERYPPPELNNAAGRPVCLVRPVTVRREWENPARNPDPEALRSLTERLARDYLVVSVADTLNRHEWLIEPEPYADVKWHHGELRFEELLGLAQSADLIVGGVGWIVPAAVATQRPTFVLLGGMGGHNAPSKIIDWRMEVGRIGWATPERFCKCAVKLHECDKRIADVHGQFDDWARGQRLPLTRERLARSA